MATKNKDQAQGGETKRVSIDADTLAKYGEEIAGLDSRIASASGNDTAARKAFIESIIAQHSTDIDQYATSIIEQIGAMDLPLLVGLVTKLEERLKADLQPKVVSYVDVEFPKTQGEKGDVDGLKERRKELLVQFKALREVLNTFGIDNAHIPDPKASRGGRTAGSGTGASKSGANKEGYRYLIDGKPRPTSQNSFSSVAYYSTEGCSVEVLKASAEFQALSPEDQEKTLKNTPKRWGADELREFIKAQGVEFGEATTFEVTLPNDKKVGARKLTDQDKIDLQLVDDANETGAATETVSETDAVVATGA